MDTLKSSPIFLSHSLPPAILLFGLLVMAAPIPILSEVALPDLKAVNSNWGNVTNLWTGTEPLQLPIKMIVDFSPRTNGVIMGLVCEYPKTDTLFESIRQRLQTQLGIKPRAETPGKYVLWRDELGKRVVTVGFDESNENIRVIVVSVDTSVR